MLNTTIISQEPNAITVKMSLRKWNHLRKLEESYKVATSIRKGHEAGGESTGYERG